MTKHFYALRKRLSILLDGDRLLYVGVLAIAALIVLCALAFPAANPASVKHAEPVDSPDGCWNTQKLIPADGPEKIEAERIFGIQRVYPGEDEFPKGLRIHWAGILDHRVLVVLERYRDLNPTLDRDYMAVYDVNGRWLYGFEGILAGESDGKKIAFRPDEEGILIWKWKGNSTAQNLYLLLEPDGEKKTFTAGEDIFSQAPAYWSSPYTVVHTKESKLIIENRETGAQTTLFDHSEQYFERYPKSSMVDEEEQWMYNAMIPIFFFVVFILVFPKLADNPDFKRKGVREPHGDLRDRWR